MTLSNKSKSSSKLVRLFEGEVYDPSAKQTLALLQSLFENIRVPDYRTSRVFLPQGTI